MKKTRFLLQFSIKEAQHQEDKRIELEAMNNVEKEIQRFENSEQIYKIKQCMENEASQDYSKNSYFYHKNETLLPYLQIQDFEQEYILSDQGSNEFILILPIQSTVRKSAYKVWRNQVQSQINECNLVETMVIPQKQSNCFIIVNQLNQLNLFCSQLTFSVNFEYLLQILDTILKMTVPADKFLFVWDVILMFVTIVNILYVPFQLSFDLGKEEIGNAYLLFSTLPSCIFLIELILNFFKGYYVRGILHTSKRDIFWHYIKGEFILDLTVVLPFIISWFGYSFANYLMLIRMTKVRRTMVVIEEISNFKEKTAVIYSLFCLIYSLLLISHFCACLFHYFAILEMDNGYSHTWLHQQGIYESDAYVKYFTSLYWVTITSMTVGYGDIVQMGNHTQIHLNIKIYYYYLLKFLQV